jgi:hypothetical protein
MTDHQARKRGSSDTTIGAAAEPEPTPKPDPAAPDDVGDEGLTPADYSIAFSPRNVAVGLAIVAGLVAFAASRRRRKGRARREDS